MSHSSRQQLEGPIRKLSSSRVLRAHARETDDRGTLAARMYYAMRLVRVTTQRDESLRAQKGVQDPDTLTENKSEDFAGLSAEGLHDPQAEGSAYATANVRDKNPVERRPIGRRSYIKQPAIRGKRRMD